MDNDMSSLLCRSLNQYLFLLIYVSKSKGPILPNDVMCILVAQYLT
jgi:hypothetical protein